MTAEIPKPAEIRKTKGYLLRRILSKWPFLVWLGVLLFTYSLYKKGVRFERMNGVIVADVETIASLEDGLIKEMTVNEKGDVVEPGALVVKLDPSIVESEIAQAKREAELERIERQLKYSTMMTEFESQIEQLELDREEDTKELELMKENLPLLIEKREKGAIRQSELDEIKSSIETLTIKVDGYPKRIQQLRDTLAEIESGLEELKTFSEDKTVENRIASDRIERMDRKSENGGRVAAIYARPGAVIRRGDPIVDIVNTKLRRAKGFVLEKDAADVSVGTKVFISVTGSSDQSFFEGEVSFVSPEITSVPDTGSSVSGRMIKGREITCTFDQESVDLLPGTSITISLTKPGKFNPFSKG